MATEQEYLALQKRTEELNQRRAVLVSKEADRKAERNQLETELKAEGIDTDRPAEEIIRLIEEIDAEYLRQKQLVDDFEQKLSQSKPGSTNTPAPAPTPTRAPEPQPNPGSLSIDDDGGLDLL